MDQLPDVTVIVPVRDDGERVRGCLQALAGQDYPRPLHVSVVSAGMQRVGSEPLAYPDMSTVHR